MPLGWIDFSKSERNKVLRVLDLLMEAGTLDELGIAPIRDGFANLFFPGTSTIQTRAKYFLIVPYALKDLEYSKETNPARCLRIFDEVERKCGEQLLSSGEDTAGVIGKRSLGQNKWVKQTPANIYWAGLRNYGIFRGNLSLSEYIRAICRMKSDKAELLKLGNKNDETEDSAGDDKDAGDLFKMQFLNIPTYSQNWREGLSIKLTAAEGEFLKTQIIHSYPDSMLAYILRNNMTEILGCKYFQDLSSLIQLFPESIQSDYKLAADFSDFLYVLRVLYNIIVSDGKNVAANSEWETLKGYASKLASIDLERIYKRLSIYRNPFLCKFLDRCKALMLAGDEEELKKEICRRERELKQNRAKTMHPGEFDPDAWFSGGALDYRFGDASTIIRDIWESEGLC